MRQAHHCAHLVIQISPAIDDRPRLWAPRVAEYSSAQGFPIRSLGKAIPRQVACAIEKSFIGRMTPVAAKTALHFDEQGAGPFSSAPGRLRPDR